MRQVSSAIAADPALPPFERRTRRAPRKLHGYFIAFALIFAAIVLTGFSRTFFIPGRVGHFLSR